MVVTRSFCILFQGWKCLAFYSGNNNDHYRMLMLAAGFVNEFLTYDYCCVIPVWCGNSLFTDALQFDQNQWWFM